MSGTIAITTFLKIEGVGRFQNSEAAEISHNFSFDAVSRKFSYLPFLYQGATVTKNGDNLESSIILANNKLASSYVVTAVDERASIDVATCLMTENSSNVWVVSKTLSVESWIATGLSYDSESIEVQLSSAVDAVGAGVPNFVLSSSMVGALPTTGNIANR